MFIIVNREVLIWRKSWQCGLSTGSDENLHYSLPATWKVTSQDLVGNWTKHPSSLPTAMPVWCGEQPEK